jgi:hypothetical protein
MFSPTSNSPMLANSGLNNPDLDGTINPASLNPSGYSSLAAGQHHMPFSPPSTATSEYHPESKPRTVDVSPRGIKRSRSPDHTHDAAGNDLGIGAGTRFCVS